MDSLDKSVMIIFLPFGTVLALLGMGALYDGATGPAIAFFGLSSVFHWTVVHICLPDIRSAARELFNKNKEIG